MAVTGVCLIPPTPGNTPLSAKLIAHLSRHHPEQEHKAFHLDYRLFSDTSSQLPGTDSKQRSFTHILAFSHDSDHAFVSATKPGEPQTSSIITIPITSLDSFTGLVQSKMQPLWYPRQMLSMEGGISVPITKRDKKWHISIGDLRVSSKTTGAGSLRGTLIELHEVEDDSNDGPTPLDKGNDVEVQAYLQAALTKIFKDTGEAFSNANFVFDDTLSCDTSSSGSADHPPDWNLAKVYMNVLRR